jgi:hypothetical protein
MQYFPKKTLFYILLLFFKKKNQKTKKSKNKTLNWLAGHPNGWLANQYTDPGVVAPPPECLAVDP